MNKKVTNKNNLFRGSGSQFSKGYLRKYAHLLAKTRFVGWYLSPGNLKSLKQTVDHNLSFVTDTRMSCLSCVKYIFA